MTDIPALAYHDPKFIDSDEGRPIRIVSEYLAPLRASRTRPALAPRWCSSARRARAAGGALGRYVDEATELARLVTQWSCSLPGGGSGSSCARAAAPASWRRPTAAPHSPAAAASGSTSACRTSSARTPSSRRGCPSSSTTSSCASCGSRTWRTRWWFSRAASARSMSCSRSSPWRRRTSSTARSRCCSTARRTGRKSINFEALVRHGTIAPEDLQLSPVRRRAAGGARAAPAAHHARAAGPARARRLRQVALPTASVRQPRARRGARVFSGDGSAGSICAAQASKPPSRLPGEAIPARERDLAGGEAAAAAAADEHRRRAVARISARRCGSSRERDVDRALEVAGARTRTPRARR